MSGLVSLMAVGAALIASTGAAQAQVIGQYNVQTAPANAGSVSPTGVAAGVNLSALTQGGGLTAGGSGNSLTFSGYDSSGTNAAAVTTANGAGDYITFTITPNAGVKVTLFSLNYTDTATSAGPSSISVRSSLDNYTTDLLLAYAPNGTARTVTLGAAFANVTTPLTFHIIGTGANNANSGATYSLLTSPFVINGTAVTAPEPGSLALAALGALPLMGAVATRRRKK